MPTDSAYDKALRTVQYNKKDFDGYVTKLKAALRLHPNKLDSVMLKGELNALTKQQLEDSLKLIVNKDGGRVYTPGDVTARVTGLLNECKAVVAAATLWHPLLSPSQETRRGRRGRPKGVL